jgi:Spy/CpxP family protein refolding chaperone
MGRFEERLDSLGLDDQTRTAVHTTLDAARAEQRDLRRQLHAAHQNLRTLLAQDTPDEATVLAQSEVIGALETEHRKQSLRTLLAVRALLTPEQRTSMREAIREHAWKPAPER